MTMFRNSKSIVQTSAALVLALGGSVVSAAPVYLLLEGDIYSSLQVDGITKFSLSEGCVSIPYECRLDKNVGQHIKITAVWDDATMFGGDADANPNKGAYGNSGYFLGTFPGAMPGLAHYSID